MTTRAIIYARRSTAEHQAASLTVQTDEARRFCTTKGWSVVDVLTEDAVSRAEFVNRPALSRLLALATSKPRTFDVVVTRDESRVGGDMYRTGMVLQELADAGVEVWYYASGERVSFDDPTGKFMAAARLYAAEIERAKIAGRTHEALAHRHRHGFNVGGRCYGYDNIRVGQHVEYRINPTEAEVVREVFEKHAAGVGVRGLAKMLNDRGVPSPHAGSRGTGSWSPSCLHAMLRRERYRGVLSWGRVGGEYRGGTRVTVKREANAIERVERPDLAIVDADLWDRAQTRSVESSGRRLGREPAYLFTGYARCSTCQGPIHVTNSKRGGEKVKVYMCGWNRSRGASVCPITVRRPIEEVDAAVLGWIRKHVMNPTVTRAILAGVRRALEASADGMAPDAELLTAQASIVRTEAEVRRLTVALASTDAPPAAIVEAIADRERKATELRSQIDALVSRQRQAPRPWQAVEAEVRADLADLSRLFSGGLPGARKALQRLIVGHPVFSPKKEGPAWEVTAKINLPGGAYLSTTPTAFARFAVDLRVAA